MRLIRMPKGQLFWLQRFRRVAEHHQAFRDVAEGFNQPLDHRADRLPNASTAPTHPSRGGRVNTDFNLLQELDAAQRLRGSLVEVLDAVDIRSFRKIIRVCAQALAHRAEPFFGM